MVEGRRNDFPYFPTRSLNLGSCDSFLHPFTFPRPHNVFLQFILSSISLDRPFICGPARSNAASYPSRSVCTSTPKQSAPHSSGNKRSCFIPFSSYEQRQPEY